MFVVINETIECSTRSVDHNNVVCYVPSGRGKDLQLYLVVNGQVTYSLFSYNGIYIYFYILFS